MKTVEFKVCGTRALFSDPVTRVGGEKFTYPVPTYEALKGVVSSIYWKPTLVWHIDEVRVMKPIRTEQVGVKVLQHSLGGQDRSYYTYLHDVEYQVKAHFEWADREGYEGDRNAAKHLAVFERSLSKGGRRDVFLGTRECQAYVEPCVFGEGEGHYDGKGEQYLGLMFHGFDYKDERDTDGLYSRFWTPTMRDGVIKFCAPEECKVRKFIHDYKAKCFKPKSEGVDE